MSTFELVSLIIAGLSLVCTIIGLIMLNTIRIKITTNNNLTNGSSQQAQNASITKSTGSTLSQTAK